ncbi:hypothetical protein [Ferrimonas balearica]|uniref:hypothetical protein n=1 Tax=Ferrimonas balearica TaxID=44012 RepID=UPI001C9524E8|nr:hypothetical protein [Ferrimonas balearica]MBY5979220.1 hypothetical protein [Ferrimonas balearica]
MHYEQLFSWRAFMDDHILVHQDGAVSVALSWRGIDSDLHSNQQILGAYNRLTGILNRLPIGLLVENHLVRDFDYQRGMAYLDYGESKSERYQELSLWVRQQMLAHIGDQGLSNRILTVLTLPPNSKSFLSLLSAKVEQKRERNLAEQLLKAAKTMANQLPDCAFLTRQQWAEMAGRLQYPDYQHHVAPLSAHEGYFLYDQWVRSKPERREGCLKFHEHYFCSGLLFFYPDAGLDGEPGLSRLLSELPCWTHIVQVLRRVDRQDKVRRSTGRTRRTRGFSTEGGQESAQSMQADEMNFRHLVANNSEVFENAYLITLATRDPEQTRTLMNDIAGYLSNLNGDLRISDEVQLTFWRLRQLGQGRYMPWWRDDVDHQVSHMWPCQQFMQGDIECPQQLRLTHTNELVTKGYRRDAVNHSITVAATGGGKGVQKCVEILETYPLGIDWYIAEVGTSYQWTVEAVGGSYIEVDPEITVINPLPDVALLNEQGELPGPVKLGTIDALSFLLLDGADRALTIHERTAAEMALAETYQNYRACSDGQPILSDYLKTLSQSCFADSTERRDAAVRMASNLDSFLRSELGQSFNQPGNFQLHPGIVGINLKPVQQRAPQLLKFYFVFIGLAFAQFAFAAGRQARVLLDEMHVLAKEAPHVARNLISGIARMGRKDGGAIDLVSQETAEMDAIENAVINQTPYLNFLYRQSDWDLIAERLEMPETVKEHWKAWSDPISGNSPFRPALMRILGRYYSLHLTFPPDLLAIASSSETDLAAKSLISPMTKDIHQRLALLKRYRELLGEGRTHEQISEVLCASVEEIC